MARPERAIDPHADAIQRFAGELRELREDSGRPTYRQLSSRTGYSMTALSEAAGGKQLPSLAVTLAYAQACGGNPAEWERRWRAVDEAMAQRTRAQLMDDAPPYLGLAAFQPGDAKRFFGRETLVADLVRRTRDRSFLAVFGPSGSGKSSLLRAGLIAEIGAGALPGKWLTVLCMPGEQPSQELARALASVPGLDAGMVHAALTAEAVGLGRMIGQALTGLPETQVLLVIDQFEELFSLCRDLREREIFVRALADLTRCEGDRVRIVIGVRADFYARCAEHPELVEAMRDASVLVGPMTAAELARAVSKPARQAGIGVDRALVPAVIRDAAQEPGALPLVSHVLLETWLQRRGDTLTLAGYELAGGVHGALACTAERAYNALPSEQQVIARQVFMRLVAFGDGTEDTRRRLSRHELSGANAEVTDQVVEHLVRARLVTRDGDSVQLAHEALIRSWPRLGLWLRQDRAGLRTHRRLTEAARAWETLGREAGALYRGTRLTVTREWATKAAHRESLTASERDFLDTSIAVMRAEQTVAARRARLLRALTSALAVLLVLAVSVSVVAIHQRQTALSQRLAAESRVQAGLDVTKAMWLAQRAYETAPTVQARSALLSVASSPAYHARLAGPGGEVKTTAFTPDSRILASAGQDRTVILWDVARQTRLAVLRGHSSSVRALAISPDGHLLATAGREGTIILWDLEQRTPLRTLPGHTGMIDGIAFSPDGRLLASAGLDDNTIIWDVATGGVRAQLAGYGGSMTEVAFTPDGHTVAIASDNGDVARWNFTSGSVRVLRASTQAVFALAFSPDGRVLATAGKDLTIALWSMPLGNQIGRLYGHTAPIRGLSFSPDGSLLASAGYDRQAILWDPSRLGRTMILTGHASALYGIAVSPDSRFIAGAGADGTTIIWDRARMPLIGHTGWASAVAFSHDGQLLATGGNDTTARLWDPTSRRTRAIMTASPYLRGPAAPSTQNPSVETVAFSPDDRFLATGGDDRTVRLWDVATGMEVGRLTGHRERVTSVAFSPDGRLLASAGGTDGTVRLWDVASREDRQILQTARADAESVAYSPDGRLLASASLDQTITLWNTTNYEKIVTLRGSSGIEQLAISPDGRRLATANTDGKIIIWDLDTRRAVATLSGHRAKLRTIAFSPNGRFLASGGLDHDVILWDLASNTRWATLTGHTDLILGLAFSPDSTTLASASGDHTIVTWTISPDKAQRRIDEYLSAAHRGPAR